MKKLLLTTIMTIMMLGLTACGTEQKATEEKAETISEYELLVEETTDLANEAIDEIYEYCEAYYALSEVYYEQYGYYPSEEELVEFCYEFENTL